MPQSERVAEFHRLHASGTFVMPNPWDAGSARALAGLGFPALATTSAGAAWALGRSDNGLIVQEVLEHLRVVAGAVDVPVNADFEGAYAIEPADVARHVSAATRTGIAGLSVEDSTGDAAHPLFEMALAVERVSAAREAIDGSGTGVLLTARSEGFVVGRPDLEDTVRRLVAYVAAGAECVYAPRITTAEQVAAIVTAVAPTPVNVLVNAPFLTVAEAAALGVRRISVGGTLARVAWGGFLQVAREIAQTGTFTGFVDLPDVDGLMRG